jgi:hypothetical protein
VLSFQAGVKYFFSIKDIQDVLSQTLYKIKSVYQVVEKLESLCTVGGDAKWCSSYGK